MHTSRLVYIWNSGKFYHEAICEKCGQKPAVMLAADCHGDGHAFCENHWKEWFNDLLSVFNADYSLYVQTDEYNGKVPGPIYKLKEVKT